MAVEILTNPIDLWIKSRLKKSSEIFRKGPFHKDYIKFCEMKGKVPLNRDYFQSELENRGIKFWYSEESNRWYICDVALKC